MSKLADNDRAVKGCRPKPSRARTRWTIDGRKGLYVDVSVKPGAPSNDGARRRDDFRRVYYFRDQRHGVFEKLGDVEHLTLAQAWKAVTDRHATATLHGRRPGFKETFEAIFNRWLERHAKVKKKSWQHDEGLYERHVKARLGSKIASEIKRRDVIDVLDEIAEKAGVQANRCQALISAVFSWALSEDLLDAHPAKGIRQRVAEIQRERVMSDGELRAFWGALTETEADNALRLLLLLGQRRAEVAEASSSELSPNLWSIPSSRTKNGLPHDVPLTPFARSLFGNGLDLYPTSLSHRFRDIARDLKLRDIRLHDLRHCCATGMARLGINRDIRERIQNQVTGRRQSIGARYDQHEYAKEKRDALERWERELLHIVGEK